jgi:hypothetical protein
MKKLLSVMLLVMAVLVVNAQETKKAPATDAKTPAASTSTPSSTSSSMLKVADLPKAVTDNIAKSYPGYTIKEVMNANGTEGADYKVVVAKGSSKETLLYAKDGKFIKKVPEKSTEKSTAPKK